jgi:hypothetical protein
LQRLRQTSPRQKLQRALDLSARMRASVMADVVRALPGASRTTIAESFSRRVYGDAIADRSALRHRECRSKSQRWSWCERPSEWAFDTM